MRHRQAERHKLVPNVRPLIRLAEKLTKNAKKAKYVKKEMKRQLKSIKTKTVAGTEML